MANTDDFNFLMPDRLESIIGFPPPMNDVREPNESAIPLNNPESHYVSTFFNEPRSANTTDPIFWSIHPPSFENVEPQKLGQTFDQDISSELPPAVQDRSVEFGFSKSPTSSLNKSQPEPRNPTKASGPNCDTPSFRRRPGRPKKSERGRYPGGTKSRSAISARREFHNDSAMRSRSKLNTLLNQLWNEVPEWQRMQALGGNASKQLSRADKVEFVTSYIRAMQARVKYDTSRI